MTGTRPLAVPEGGRGAVTTSEASASEGTGTAGSVSESIEQAVQAYREADAAYGAASERLSALNDAAELAGDHGAADDFRNYAYAEAAEAALAAAQHLLRLLGYGAEPADTTKLTCGMSEAGRFWEWSHGDADYHVSHTNGRTRVFLYFRPRGEREARWVYRLDRSTRGMGAEGVAKDLYREITGKAA